MRKLMMGIMLLAVFGLVLSCEPENVTQEVESLYEKPIESHDKDEEPDSEDPDS